MSEKLHFERRVDDGFEAADAKIKKMGASSYRLETGSDGDLDFGNRMTRERFNEKFIEELNQHLGPEKQLDVRDRDVERALREVHRNLERGENKFSFRINPRMEN